MADNVGYTPGTGATIAADDVGGVLYQRVKLASGVDGAAADISSSNPMPVSDSANNCLTMLMSRLISIFASPVGYDRSLNRNRVTAIVESGTVTTVSTVSTVTTVSTVSSVTAVAGITNIGSLPAQMLVNGQTSTAWAQTVRSRIS